MPAVVQRLVQLTLDFFDAPAAPPPIVATRVPVLGTAVPSTAPEPEPMMAPVVFSHPRGNRHIALAGAVVAYEFKRARRRSIGFVIGPDGLVVSAPRWVALGEVEAAVRSKGDWIVRKLDEARQRQQCLAEARIEWREGAELPFLGRTVRLALDPRQRSGAAGAALDAESGVLQIALPRDAAPAQLRDAVQAWLMRQAKRVFTERLEHFAPQLGVQWRKLSLSSAGTRWGSASADGSIRLNWRLVHFRLAVIDYVVAHELSHLRVMDHSPRFWDTVAEVVPDYAALRGQLKDAALPTWE